jgi:predicted nucleotidyltransferase
MEKSNHTMNSPHDTPLNLTPEEITHIVKKNALKDKEILAAISFGSYPQKGFSDIDVCIVLYPGKYDNLYISERKLQLMVRLKDFDIHIFQQLPLYIRVRVLKGDIIFCRDEKMLYEIAVQTMKEFEDYKRIYYEYLSGVARG